MELQKIVASLGDGHSVLYPFSTERVTFRYLPLGFYFFPEGLFVVGAGERHADLVGLGVTAIGGRSTATVLEDLEPWVSRDNRQGLRWIGPRYLTVLAMLRAMGYPTAEDSVTVTVEEPASPSSAAPASRPHERP